VITAVLIIVVANLFYTATVFFFSKFTLKMMNRFNFLVFIGLFVFIDCKSQDTPPFKPVTKAPKNQWKDSLYYGGNLGVQLTSNGTLIDLSPNVGYKFNKILSIGLQAVFTTLSYRTPNYNYRYTFYGLGSFIRIKPVSFLFLQAEYDLLNVPDNFATQKSKRTFADVNLAGIGIRNEIQENACYYLLLLYEFVPTPNSPYTNGPFNSPLVYRAGFNINF